MSDAARDQVWRGSQHKGATFIVALAVADVVNDTYGNEFFMHIDLLAQKTRLSRRSVMMALEELTRDGWLVELESGQGRGNKNRYRWQFIDDLPVIFDTKRKGANSARFNEAEKVQNFPQKVQNFPKSHLDTNLLLTERTETLFEEFWKIYPRHDAKKTAKTSFLKAIKTTDPQVIIKAATAYAAIPRDPKYIAMAATWLNQERWADESVTMTAPTPSQPPTPTPPKFSTADIPQGVPMPEDIKAIVERYRKQA